MSEAHLTCSCGHQSDWPLPLSFRAQCPACDNELHTCRHCEHHKPGHHNDCVENQAERVLEKDRGNRCDWFRPGHNTPTAPKPDMRVAAEALFKK